MALRTLFLLAIFGCITEVHAFVIKNPSTGRCVSSNTSGTDAVSTLGCASFYAQAGSLPYRYAPNWPENGRGPIKYANGRCLEAVDSVSVRVAACRPSYGPSYAPIYVSSQMWTYERKQGEAVWNNQMGPGRLLTVSPYGPTFHVNLTQGARYMPNVRQRFQFVGPIVVEYCGRYCF